MKDRPEKKPHLLLRKTANVLQKNISSYSLPKMNKVQPGSQVMQKGRKDKVLQSGKSVVEDIIQEQLEKHRG